ncbi:DNA-directed RNA polymerase subunit beta [Frankliniella fusca]|uniref:DNA-directed RNA polymerase subunit beta n=1 Tax=Frankliniella fusca TaxID=407009 RepID=A0AAE1GVG6_9NEOP|nr:DNA-directed RNA polymerase subunit beta [Frankliniella fusca]
MSTDQSDPSTSQTSNHPNLDLGNVFEQIGGFKADLSLLNAPQTRDTSETAEPEIVLPCSIGLIREHSVCSASGKKKSQLLPLEQKLLKLRTNVTSTLKVCSNHYEEFLTRYNQRQKVCGAKLKCSGSRTGDLRTIDYENYENARRYGEFALVPGQLWCLTCRLHVRKVIKTEQEIRNKLKKEAEECGKKYEEPFDPGSPLVSESESEESSESQGTKSTATNPSLSQTADADFPTPPQCAREKLNQALTVFGKSPVDTKKFSRSKTYASEKLQEVESAVKKSAASSSSAIRSENVNKDFDEMLERLVEKFNSVCTTTSEKFMILSILPPNWSRQKVMDTFGCTKYFAQAVERKVERDGILCTPTPKQGKRLSDETEKKVIATYEDDMHGRLMPGKRDYKSVIIDGKRVQVQKRLLLLTIKELHQLFLEEFPTFQISLSKFAMLRPTYVILDGASGTHSVCVCTIHQNVKLMLHGARLGDSVRLQDGEIVQGFKNLEECMSIMLSETPTDECYFGTCTQCPGTQKIKEKLEEIFNAKMIETVEYKQWTVVDRSDLITVTQDRDEFIDLFLEKMEKLIEHDFITNQQATFMSKRKSILQEGEIFVVGDFTMNYKPVIQDAAQSYHWTNAGITLHPWVCYFLEDGIIKHKSFIMVSDNLHHDTGTVYAFQVKLIEQLKIILPNMKKVIYSSDGARSQYKNKKNVANLCHHFVDFGVEAEWHFSATSHGKGASDGAGGSAKRSAYKESLRSPTEGHILTAPDFVKFVNKELEKITAVFVSNEEVQEQNQNLKSRFSDAEKLPGISSYHSIIPVSSKAVIVRRYSYSSNSERIQLVAEKPDSLDNLSGFVTIIYENQWWLSKISSVERTTVKVRRLNPAASKRGFRFSANDSDPSLSREDLLVVVTPTTNDNVSFSLPKQSRTLTEQTFASKQATSSANSPILGTSTRGRERRRQ